MESTFHSLKKKSYFHWIERNQIQKPNILLWFWNWSLALKWINMNQPRLVFSFPHGPYSHAAVFLWCHAQAGQLNCGTAVLQAASSTNVGNMTNCCHFAAASSTDLWRGGGNQAPYLLLISLSDSLHTTLSYWWHYLNFPPWAWWKWPPF